MIWAEDSADRVAIERHVESDLATKINAVANQLDMSILIFIATRTLQPNSAAVRHFGLWRSPLLGSVPLLEKRWPETTVYCGNRIRIGTLGMVTPTALEWMLRLNNLFDVAVPVLLPRGVVLAEKEPLDLLQLAFPPQGCRPTPDFDWPRFSTRIAAIGGISLRRSNDYARSRVIVDFFASDDCATKVAGLLQCA